MRMVSANKDGTHNFEHKITLATIEEIKEARDNSDIYYTELE